jgi:hypothetical protein
MSLIAQKDMIDTVKKLETDVEVGQQIVNLIVVTKVRIVTLGEQGNGTVCGAGVYILEAEALRQKTRGCRLTRPGGTVDGDDLAVEDFGDIGVHHNGGMIDITPLYGNWNCKRDRAATGPTARRRWYAAAGWALPT